MSDVQAVMWMCAPLGTHSVHVWTSLVCAPMCEAHTTHQLHSSNISGHGVHGVCVWCGRARRVCTCQCSKYRVHTCTSAGTFPIVQVHFVLYLHCVQVACPTIK